MENKRDYDKIRVESEVKVNLCKKTKLQKITILQVIIVLKLLKCLVNIQINEIVTIVKAFCVVYDILILLWHKYDVSTVLLLAFLCRADKTIEKKKKKIQLFLSLCFY